MQPLSPARLPPPSPPAQSLPLTPPLRSAPSAPPGVVRALGTALGGLLLAATAAVALSRWALEAPSPLSAIRTEDALWSLMVWTGTTLAGWLGLGSVLAVGAALPGAVGTTCARLDRWLTPRLLRQAVSLALGTTMATLALPAGAANGAGLSRVAGQADSTPDPVDSPTAASSASAATTATTETTATAEVLQPAGTSPDPAFSPTGTPSPTATPVSADPLSTVGAPPPGWRPSPPPRIVDTDESRLLAPTPRSTVPDATITVLRGDTLWHIAARHLGPGATDAEIALEWPRWHDANRDVIGADADLLVPGQQLRPPTSGSSR